jgi:DNA-binding beta-propeller fold protein YncE
MARLLVCVIVPIALVVAGCAKSELGGPRIDPEGGADAGLEGAERRPTSAGNAVSTQSATSATGAASSTATGVATSTATSASVSQTPTTLCETSADTMTLSLVSSVPYLAAGFETAQLAAMLTSGDAASAEDVSAEADWTLADPTLGTLDDDGRFTSAQVGGRVVITVSLGAQRCTGALVVTGPITRIPLLSRALRAVARPGHDEVWVTSDGDAPGSVTIVDIRTNTVTGRVDLGYGVQPQELVFLPSGDKAYLSTAGYDAVKVIDAHTRRVSKVVKTRDPGVALAVGADGSTVYFAQTASPKGVYAIDTTTDKSRLFDRTLACPAAIAFGALDTLYVSDGCSGGLVRVNRLDGGFALLGGSHESAGDGVEDAEPREDSPFLAITPDGSRLFTQDRVLRAADLASLEQLPEPARWSFFPDGTRAVAAGSRYEVHDYAGAQLVLLARLGSDYTPPAGARAAVGPNATLYLPLRDDEGLQVMQFAP